MIVCGGCNVADRRIRELTLQGASRAEVVAPAGARSAASGLYVSSYYLGGAVGGVLPAVAWHLGGWPACVALVAALQLATIALAWRFWRPARAVERAASLAA